MLNPYSQASLLDFVKLFFQRLFTVTTTPTPLASDELQVLTLALIAASCAIVGVFLIYRKMTMQANALSHSILFGIALTYILTRSFNSSLDVSKSFQLLLVVALISGFVTALFTHLIVKLSRLQKDAAVGLVFTTLFAVGVLLISLFSRNSHVGLEMVMGNVDALHQQDLFISLKVFSLSASLVLIFFGGLKISTFDPIFSVLRGVRASFYNYLIIFLLSMTAVGSFRAVGVVLVLSFFIVPPMIAKDYARSLFSQILIAMGFGVLCAFLGVGISRHLLSVYALPLSTGAITVLVLYMAFFMNYLGHVLAKKVQLVSFLKKQPRLN